MYAHNPGLIRLHPARSLSASRYQHTRSPAPSALYLRHAADLGVKDPRGSSCLEVQRAVAMAPRVCLVQPCLQLHRHSESPAGSRQQALAPPRRRPPLVTGAPGRGCARAAAGATEAPPPKPRRPRRPPPAALRQPCSHPEAQGPASQPLARPPPAPPPELLGLLARPALQLLVLPQQLLHVVLEARLGQVAVGVEVVGDAHLQLDLPAPASGGRVRGEDGPGAVGQAGAAGRGGARSRAAELPRSEGHGAWAGALLLRCSTLPQA
jgi:hypothetical protein